MGRARKHLLYASRALIIHTLSTLFSGVVNLGFFRLPKISNRIDGIILEEKHGLVVNLWKAEILNFRK